MKESSSNHFYKYAVCLFLIVFTVMLGNVFSTDQKTVKNALMQIQLPLNAHIVCFDSTNIFYFLEDSKGDENFPEKSLYKSNLTGGDVKKLADLSEATTATESIAFYKNKLYLPCKAANQKNMLFEIEEDKLPLILTEWTADTVFSYVYVIEDTLVLFCIDAIDGTKTEYSIRTIDLEDKSETLIVKKTFDQNGGTAISSVDIDSGYIYGFLVTKDRHESTHSIEKYALDGTVCETIPLKLNDFLRPPDPVNIGEFETDTVYNFYKKSDFFILSTINGRVCIFKQTEAGVELVSIPKEMYEPYPSGYRYLDFTEQSNQNAYFINGHKSENALYIFDYHDGTFTSIDLPNATESIYSYYRNVEGDLLFQRRDINEPDTPSYYYLNENDITGDA